ncbi:hypothetical protein [Paenibacillus macquariensis]|uniref:Uncharacterized protein n=1 Tax=Paenibacillus macquariensis TaxID=948756 RepID=A0ABY1JKC9_9BACL|nr:hypothetical protein [Paenibacillus macquariensis]MEC0089907.1 hypothetical protein [Paenibacillus macquariensis]OAB31201.1 hypothetical protein PMSM_21005 [Paenibacillus macquariensis subsp. macquariensis]SIQ34041.1 hypothetical protein SAMN05421578_101293 [Paenibacillus macquariensis]
MTIMNVIIPTGTIINENKMSVRYADGMHDILLELKDGSMKPLQLLLDKASESKAYFIQFINSLELVYSTPWLVSWIDEYFTDAMAKVFFDKFWNGSWEVRALYTAAYEELPSIIDDMSDCINSFAH